MPYLTSVGASSEAARIVKLTQYHCPRLQRFDVLDFNDFSLLVIEKWQAGLNVV